MQPAAILNVLVRTAGMTKTVADLQKVDRKVNDTATNTKRLDGAKLGFNFDRTGVDVYNRELEKIERTNARRDAFKAHLGADFNAKAFNAFNRDAEKAITSTRKLDNNTSHLGRSARSASAGIGKLAPGLSLATRIPVYKFVAIAGAIQAAVPPTIALTSALAPLSGLLGALPGLASAAAQGIGTMVLGFKGVGDAIGAAFDAQKTASQDAGTAATAQRAAAESVRSAVQAVGDAERGLADAQRQSKLAQEELSDARRDASRELVDMQLAVQGTALSEKEARLQLTEAIKEQVKVEADASSTAVETREAALAVQRARLGVKEATVGSKRAQEDYNKAQRKGISGSDQVVSAQRGLADAQRGVADAQRSLVEATRQVRLAQLEQAESADKASARVTKLQQAMAGLPVAARNFAKFIIDLKPRLDSLRDAAASGIFPGLTRGIQAAMQNFGAVRTVIASTATALGELGESFGKRLGSADWGRDIQVQGERNVETITRLGHATISLADGFRHIMLAAGPLVSFLTSSAERFSAVFASWAEGARTSGRLDAFFQKTIKTTKLTVEAFWDFGRALINIGKIADRVWGQDLLRGINDVAERFRDWTESVRGERAIEGYFVRWRRRWGDIAKAVGDVFGEYNRLRREGKSVADASAHVLADTIAKLLPRLAESGFQIGAQIAGGVLRGFRDADPLGKLFIGTVVAKKLGLLKPLFALAGRKAGAAYATGAATGTATAMAKSGAAAAAGGAAAGGGMFAVQHARERAAGGAAAGAGAGAVAGRLKSGLTKLGPAVRTIGKGALAFQLLSGIADGITRQGIKGIGDRFQQAASTFTAGILPAPKAIDERLQAIAAKIRTWKDGRLKLSDPSDPDNSLIRQKDLDDFTGRQRKMLMGLANLRNTATDLFGRDFKLNARMEFKPELASRRLRELANEFGRMRSGAVTDVKQLREVTAANFRRIAETMGVNSKDGQQAVAKNFRLALQNIQSFKERGVITAGQAGREIARLMKTQSGKGKDALAENMLAAQRSIGRTMQRGGELTDKGMGLIRRLMRGFMKDIGLSADTIRMSENKHESAKKGFTQPGQTGLVVKGGKPSGDSVHALLERGEVVVNRTAVQKLGGPHEVNKLNSMIPRFQSGGIAGMVSAANRLDKAEFPYKWGGGHQDSPAPFGPMDCSGAVSYVLQHGGVEIPTMVSGALAGAGKPGPGKVTVFANAGHTFMRIGNRYFGTSGSNPGGGAGWFPDPGAAYKSGFEQRHFLAGGAGALGRIPRLGIGGPDSMMKSVVQGALDTSRSSANKRLRQIEASTIGAGDPGDPGPGGADYKGPLNKNFGKNSATKIGFNQAAMLAERAGLPGVTYAQIAIGESGLRPGAVSPDGGYGLWQMTPRVQSAQTVAAWEKIGSYFNPWNNARQAKYLAGSGTGTSNYFGTGSVTDWNAHYTGPMKGLQKGGVVGYAGDSLGVGTIGPLRGLLNDRKVEGHPSSGKTSSWGVGQLIKGAAQHVFDFGTNDATGAAIRASINKVNSKTGNKPVHVLTVNGTPPGGQTADVKNKAIRAAAHGDVRLVDWAAQHKGQLDSLGHGAYPERARLLAASIRGATGSEGDTGATFAQKPKWTSPEGLNGMKGQVPLSVVLSDTMRNIRGLKGKALKKTLGRLKKRLPDVEVPENLKNQISFLTTASEIFGERAGYAGELTTEAVDANGEPILDAENRQVINWGSFGGLNEPQWLQKQLETLFSLRNKLTDGFHIGTDRLALIKSLIAKVKAAIQKLRDQAEKANKRREELNDEIDKAEQRKKHLVADLKSAKHAKDEKKVKRLQGEIDQLDDRQKGRHAEVHKINVEQRERHGQIARLKTNVLPAFEKRLQPMEEFLGDVTPALADVQGTGGPLEHLASLPAFPGLGGQIFNVQKSITDLLTPGPVVDRGGATSDSDSAELLKELLREANLRTAVSERQFDIFRNFDFTSGTGAFPAAGSFMGAFAKGGVALVGEKGPELAHLPSGTRIHSATDTASMVSPNVSVHVYEGEGRAEVFIDDRKIDAAVERVTRRQARHAGRRLPGRGGGV